MARPCRIQTGFPFTRVRRSCAAQACRPARRIACRVFLARAFALVAASVLAACAAPAHVDVPHRIVSLMPSLTEDLFAIGAGPLVVGVSEFTDFPPAAAKLPVVATFASADAERIVTLHPDVVVGITSQTAPAADVRKAGIRTVLLDDDGFDDIFRDIEALGLLTARDDDARALTDRLRARTTALMTFCVHSGFRLVNSSFMVMTQQGWFFQISPVKRSMRAPALISPRALNGSATM